ncbi:MAG: hypothetical protein U5R14_08870 [Gemmatimonadota bacterium]|nr:hypothetical protein [Gemmatimonadota bacterium]
MSELIHYLPLATTLVAAGFAPAVLGRWSRKRPAPHLFWWGIGVVCYGFGTLTESVTTLFGWSEPVFRAWYVSGALLGAAPLAQGTAYLMLQRRVAHGLTAALGLLVAVAATVVIRSPIDLAAVEPYGLTGAALAWPEARMFSPFINTYALVLLAGGAVVSALRYRGDPGLRHRFLGNVYIAMGAVLPGIGGTAARMGATEVLYMTELVGLVLIWVGYRYNVRRASHSTAGSSSLR